MEPLALSPPRLRLRNFGTPVIPPALELQSSSRHPGPRAQNFGVPRTLSPALGLGGPCAPGAGWPAGLTLLGRRPPVSGRASGATPVAALTRRCRAPRSLPGSPARALRAALRTARAFVCAAAAAARAASGPIAAGPDADAARPASRGRRGRPAAPPAGPRRRAGEGGGRGRAGVWRARGPPGPRKSSSEEGRTRGWEEEEELGTQRQRDGHPG